MKKWVAKVKNFLISEDGPTAVEYAVMLALIIVVCIAAISTLGSNASNTFTNVSLNTAAGSSSSGRRPVQQTPRPVTVWGRTEERGGRVGPGRRAHGRFPSRGTHEMRKFTNALVKFLKAEDGPTAVEYAVMLALIIVVCIAAISALGSNASNTFSYVGNKVNTTSS